MGCASSKRIQAAVDVYRPAPASFAVFDINSIEEPWLKADDSREQNDVKVFNDKPVNVPSPVLEKLNAIEDAPRSWEEVSKTLEDLKPKINNPPPPPAAVDSTAKAASTAAAAVRNGGNPDGKPPRKSFSFHTLEELDAKITAKPKELRKTESFRSKSDSVKPELKKSQLNKTESRDERVPTSLSQKEVQTEGFSSVKDNIFILRDKMEREKEGKPSILLKRDPLSEFEDKCPPGGADAVVVYATSLAGVRRTYEDCHRVKMILETRQIVYDERDVSLHGEFLNELRELLGEGVSVPRVFVKGKYIGGVEELVSLNESGRIARIVSWARVERGTGRLGCEGCGGARFVPCLDCGGSCKVLVDNRKERCGNCNENGLVHCPLCN